MSPLGLRAASGTTPAAPTGPLAAVPSPPAVAVDGVTKRFGDTTALDDVSLTLPAGRLVTLLGPSGCGKTTLLRLLAGLEQADAGTIAIGGEDMRRRPPERRPVNMVFQRYALFPHRDVLDNVLFGLQSARVAPKEARARAMRALAMCRMEGFEHRKVDQLSGGQAQRVAVARALVNDPRVLLLDEPLAALDLKLRRHMQVELRRLQRELGTTFVYVTHDQDEALALSDLIVLMDGGRIVQCAPPRELYDEPNCVFAATFLGEANVLEGTVVDLADGLATLSVAGVEFAGVAGAGLAVGRGAHLCVRPERVTVVAAADAGTPGTVVEVTFQGAAVRYLVRLDAGPALQAEAEVRPGDELLEPGAAVRVGWPAADARALEG